jgi:hypothetical protein
MDGSRFITVTLIWLAQGDSWFNYWIGRDILYWLHKDSGWEIDSIAVAGSTLNDVVYGPVPKDLLDFRQTDAPSRRGELIYRIKQDKPAALLLSMGGNDVAGEEFFSFVNNAMRGRFFVLRHRPCRNRDDHDTDRKTGPEIRSLCTGRWTTTLEIASAPNAVQHPTIAIGCTAPQRFNRF